MQPGRLQAVLLAGSKGSTPLLSCSAVLITGLYADGKCVAARLGGGVVEGCVEEQILRSEKTI